MVREVDEGAVSSLHMCLAAKWVLWFCNLERCFPGWSPLAVTGLQKARALR